MAHKKYNIILARHAERMLLSHTKFLTKVSPSAAKRLLEDFRKVINSLANNPFQFPIADTLDVPNIPPETYRKCLFDGRYKTLFLVEDDNVYIDAVIDCRQENNNLFLNDPLNSE